MVMQNLLRMPDGSVSLSSPAFASDEFGDINSGLDIAARLLEDLPHFARHQGSKLFLALLQQEGCAQQNLASFGSWSRGPSRLSLARGFNSIIKIGCGRFLVISNHLTGMRRIGANKRLSAPGGTPLTSNEILINVSLFGRMGL